MTIDFVQTEILEDNQILKEFGYTLEQGEGKFIKENLFESIEEDLAVAGSSLTNISKEEIIKRLKVLLTKLAEEL